MNVRLRHELEFVAGAWADSELEMAHYRLRIHYVTATAVTEEHGIAINRIKYFLYSCIESAVFINQNDVAQIRALHRAGIRVVTVPTVPIDQIIGIMLYYKLNAILEQRFLITELEITSDLTDGIVFLHNEHESVPEFNKSGWWNQPDLQHFDASLINDKKVLSIKNTPNWHEVDLAWPTEPVTSDPDDNRVVFASFQKNETK